MGDYSKLRIEVTADTAAVPALCVEVLKSRGTGTLVSRLYQQILAMLKAAQPLTTLLQAPSLQPYRPPVCAGLR